MLAMNIKIPKSSVNWGSNNGIMLTVPTNIPLTEGVVAIFNKFSKQPISRKNNENVNDNGLNYFDLLPSYKM